MIELLEASDGLPPGNYSLPAEDENRLVQSGKARVVSGQVLGLSQAQLLALRQGQVAALIAPGSTPSVTRMGTGLVKSGACRLKGWYAGSAAGTVTLYNALSAAGTPIQAASDVLAGYISFGDTGLYLSTGLYVVLSSGTQSIRFDFY